MSLSRWWRESRFERSYKNSIRADLKRLGTEYQAKFKSAATGNDFDWDLLYTNYAALFRWKGVNYSTLAATRTATGFETNGRAGDPLFTNAATGDWTLRAGSPAIDAGLRMPGLNDRYADLRVANRFHGDWILENYQDVIRKAISELLGRNVALRIVVSPSVSAPDEGPEEVRARELTRRGNLRVSASGRCWWPSATAPARAGGDGYRLP